MYDGVADETVVIGVGSPLMGDDGIGVAALESLREGWTFEPHVEMLDGGTWGMNLLPFIEVAKRVILLDAIDVGADPGSVVVLERDALPRFFSTKISPHQIDLREVLALAELRGKLPDDTVAIGLQPGRVEMSVELSPVVTRAFPELLRRVVERIESWGHESREVVHDA